MQHTTTGHDPTPMRGLDEWIRLRAASPDPESTELFLGQLEGQRSRDLVRLARDTAQEQCIQIGRTRYHVRLVAIPLLLHSTGELPPEGFQLDPVLKQMMSAVRGAYRARKGVSGVLLNTLIPSRSLASMNYAAMYRFGRDLFLSSTVDAALDTNSEGLRDMRVRAAQDVLHTRLGCIFHGYVLGVVFSREERSLALDADAARARVGQLLSANAAGIGHTVLTKVGPVAPVYEAMERQYQMVLEHMTESILDGADAQNDRIEIELAHPDDAPDHPVLRVSLIDGETGDTSDVLSTSLPRTEHGVVEFDVQWLTDQCDRKGLSASWVLPGVLH